MKDVIPKCSETGWAWLSATDRKQPDYWTDPTWTANEMLPVVGVTWYEASAYCRWLSKQSSQNYRLPTEFEWEIAAQGSDNRLYPWGNDFDPTLCNMALNGVGRSTLIGQYSPDGDSPWDCADMAGNVSEWTASLFRPYPYDPAAPNDDPPGEGPPVTRGGSWHSNLLRVRTTSRGYIDPWFNDHDLGFRLAGDGKVEPHE